MSRYIWLTNASESTALSTMEILNRGYNPPRNLVTSEPMKSTKYTTAQLKAIGTVGIYEVKQM